MNAPQSVTCLVCAAAEAPHWFTYDSSFDGRSYDIRKCSVCKSGFAWPVPSARYLADFYAGEAATSSNAEPGCAEDRMAAMVAEQERFPNALRDAKRMAERMRFYATGDRLLDVGAGRGLFSRAAAQEGFEVSAVEYSQQAREVYALVNGFDAMEGGLTPEFAQRNEGRFDVVLLSQVLEHLPLTEDPVAMISRLLAPGGVAAIAVPHLGGLVSRVQGKRDMFIYPPEHINYFSLAGLDRLFARAGFTKLETRTVSHVDSDKFRNRLRPAPLGVLAVAGMKASFALADHADMGQIIQAHYRKG